MKAPTEADVLAQIQRIAEAELGWRDPITPAQRLVHDLGLDSLGSLVLAVGLEDHYRIKLNEQDGVALKTVADVIALVRQRVTEC